MDGKGRIEGEKCHPQNPGLLFVGGGDEEGFRGGRKQGAQLGGGLGSEGGRLVIHPRHLGAKGLCKSWGRREGMGKQ
jgi:hypothetical protein